MLGEIAEYGGEHRQQGSGYLAAILAGTKPMNRVTPMARRLAREQAAQHALYGLAGLTAGASFRFAERLAEKYAPESAAQTSPITNSSIQAPIMGSW